MTTLQSEKNVEKEKRKGGIGDGPVFDLFQTNREKSTLYAGIRSPKTDEWAVGDVIRAQCLYLREFRSDWLTPNQNRVGQRQALRCIR